MDLAALAAFAASLVALFIAVFGGVISYKRSNLIPSKKLVKTVHTDASGVAALYFRLEVENKPHKLNRLKAVDVEVDVIKKYNKTSTNNNFVPAPLEWTHPTNDNNRIQRTIRPNQTALLDICQWWQPLNASAHQLTIRAPHIFHSNITNIDPGKTKLTLAVWQESGQKMIWEINISWENTEQEPIITCKENE